MMTCIGSARSCKCSSDRMGRTTIKTVGKRGINWLSYDGQYLMDVHCSGLRPPCIKKRSYACSSGSRRRGAGFYKESDGMFAARALEDRAERRRFLSGFLE